MPLCRVAKHNRGNFWENLKSILGKILSIIDRGLMYLIKMHIFTNPVIQYNMPVAMNTYVAT